MESIEVIAQNIEGYVALTAQLEMICKYYKIDLNASPLYNFRDALSHYILCYDAKLEEEKLAQESSINEHIFRGAKDICVFILYKMKDRTSAALNGKDSTRKKQQDFRGLLHEFKKLELEIRRNTESTVIRSLTPFVISLNALIEKAKRVFEQYEVSLYD